jgi:hypothetical protein
LTTVPDLASGHAGEAGSRLPYYGALTWTLVIAGCAIQFDFTRLGGFWLDDYHNLGQARAAGLTFQMLAEPIMGLHFQPTSRLLEWISVGPFHENYVASEALLAVITGLGAYLLVRLLDALFGERDLHLVIGFLFATSWLLMSTNQWYSAGVAVASTVFSIGACLGFALWVQRGGSRPYALALVSAAVAVMAWEQALAIPGWLFLIWFCFQRRAGDRRPGQVLLGLVPFFGVSFAYLAYVQTQPWHTALALPPLTQWLALGAVVTFHALLPTLIGSGLSDPDIWEWPAILLPVVVLALGAAWLVAHHRFRASSLLFFLAALLLVIAPVATARDYIGAAAAGNTGRYLDFGVFVLLLAIAGAVRESPTEGERRHWPVAFAPVVAGLGILYLANLAVSFTANPFEETTEQAASGYTTQMAAGLAALSPSQQESVVDAVLPFPVWYQTNNGQSELSWLLPFWSSTLHTFGEGPQLTIPGPSGALQYASFQPGGSGPQYVSLTVAATRHAVLTVDIRAGDASQPEVPWVIAVDTGTHSFTVPAWSNRVLSVTAGGAGLRVVAEQIGTLTLGLAVGGP